MSGSISRHSLLLGLISVQVLFKKLICIENVGHDTIQVILEAFYEAFHTALKEAEIK